MTKKELKDYCEFTNIMIYSGAYKVFVNFFGVLLQGSRCTITENGHFAVVLAKPCESIRESLDCSDCRTIIDTEDGLADVQFVPTLAVTTMQAVYELHKKGAPMGEVPSAEPIREPWRPLIQSEQNRIKNTTIGNQSQYVSGGDSSPRMLSSVKEITFGAVLFGYLLANRITCVHSPTLISCKAYIIEKIKPRLSEAFTYDVQSRLADDYPEILVMDTAATGLQTFRLLCDPGDLHEIFLQLTYTWSDADRVTFLDYCALSAK